MENAPQEATLGSVPDAVIESMIEVSTAHANGQPVSDAEAVFYLFAGPVLLRELLDRRRAQAGVDWMNRPTNVVELAARAPLKLVQPEGAA